MKNKALFSIVSLLVLAFFISSCNKKLPVDFVNPFIGTSGHGHTFPGVSMPFGMVQLSPDTRLTGWDGCSGYHRSDTFIYGFSHTHLSGTGCSDYGDILLMPTARKSGFNNMDYRSAFKHSNEKASPGFYAVTLDDNQVDVELTCSQRVGFHKYTFTGNDERSILLDLEHRDMVLDCKIIKVDKNRVEGLRLSSAWADSQYVYFAIEFSEDIVKQETKSDKIAFDSLFKDVKARYYFNKQNEKPLFVKVAISAVSCENAWKNMKTEIPGWHFDSVRNAAKETWNKELGKIEVEGGSKAQKTTFYTALYHALLSPNIYSDVDGQYRGRDMKIHQTETEHPVYTVFSLWDTYRAEHPLLTIIDRKRTNDFIRTFIRQYQEGGALPVWELSANETGCMIGYHAVPVIADAFKKGIRDYDINIAYEAMKHSANLNHLGLDVYRQLGYIPSDKEHESVSKTLEYAYDDWCIAQIAKAMGKNAEYDTFIERAQFYKNIFDPQTGFMRPKQNGSWLTPFDPKQVDNNFTEANSWQYSFYVPQDVNGLIMLHGGKEKFINKLDQLFNESTQTTGREQADITGLIGQYAHGNEPSHHIAYLYAYAGAAWKTQEMTHRIMTEMYNETDSGLCGNEDCGQMSAWYVMSAMGLYPVCPGSEDYIIGSPIFKKITIHLENGKNFIINAKGVSKQNFYIQSAQLNGKKYSKSFLNYTNLINGGNIGFVMDSRPNKDWGKGEGNEPLSGIDNQSFVMSPTIKFVSKVFHDSLTIEFDKMPKGYEIYYFIHNSSVEKVSDINQFYLPFEAVKITLKILPQVYSKPFTIKGTSFIEFFATNNTKISRLSSAEYYKIPNGRSVQYIDCQYNNQYSAGGHDGLIDGIRGEKNWRLGGWQGFQSQNFKVVVDLGKVHKLSMIGAGFLQDTKSWILMPKEVNYEISEDGKKYFSVGKLVNDIPDKEMEIKIKDFIIFCYGKSARFVKITAINYGKLPKWHQGYPYDGDAFIFVDEIFINR